MPKPEEREGGLADDRVGDAERAATMSGAVAPGSMWRRDDPPRLSAPRALAAATKSISRKCRNSPRTSLAAVVQPAKRDAR